MSSNSISRKYNLDKCWVDIKYNKIGEKITSKVKIYVNENKTGFHFLDVSKNQFKILTNKNIEYPNKCPNVGKAEKIRKITKANDCIFCSSESNVISELNDFTLVKSKTNKIIILDKVEICSHFKEMKEERLIKNINVAQIVANAFKQKDAELQIYGRREGHVHVKINLPNKSIFNKENINKLNQAINQVKTQVDGDSTTQTLHSVMNVDDEENLCQCIVL